MANSQPVGSVVRSLGAWISEYVGCNPDDVLGLDFHLHMDDIATVDVRMIVREGEEISEQIKRYALSELATESEVAGE